MAAAATMSKKLQPEGVEELTVVMKSNGSLGPVGCLFKREKVDVKEKAPSQLESQLFLSGMTFPSKQLLLLVSSNYSADIRIF